MPGVLHLGAVSSSSEVVVRLSVLPSSFHLVFPFSSKNMKGGGNKNTYPASRNVSSGQQSASARERTFYNKVGRSSPNPDRSCRPPPTLECSQIQTFLKTSEGVSEKRCTRSELHESPFDICKTASPFRLKKPLLEINRGRRKEAERAKNDPLLQYLRPGMVLLKKFISHTDQVAIVKKCRDLGIGCGGFYRPGYRDGAKLHLQMMCLGKNWNPDSRSYEECRSFDNVVPPEIPKEFKKLVDGALHVSRDFLHQSAIDAEEVSIMSPNVCIVNFYNDSGRLGLHQDRDESKESLEKGLPVVSFSIGDSAEFLYSDVRDVDSAEKVILESGDVLIFGGKSRHIFHGVSCIKPKTAPQLLNDDANLRPGRLNLTFRQY
ncbi:hypothetical protein HPP92_000038 [Vanilla planifolia]|uniref:Fe2OG dioxygenase domain-containing protein n=1 Tax=Vanilla planifolia TaxID=51239 RepID=A0A835S1A7_VANPL|nr:hypothetical protein HPP92_000038 [Vanilla planifolia]